jgi:hypothetical protein
MEQVFQAQRPSFNTLKQTTRAVAAKRTAKARYALDRRAVHFTLPRR